MGAAVTLRNIVGETEDLLLIRVIPLHRDFHDDSLLFGDGVEYIVVQHRFIAIDELHKTFYTAGKSEVLLLARELIHQPDLDPVVKE
jgi:hypothetical protein